MDDILFTCAGTSDPVRGNRDGGILHIMRYYHPKRVYLFLSQQIADLEAQDHRFEKTFQHMQEVCAEQGTVYQPSLFMHNSQLCDASKIDLVEKPLLEYFTSVAAENPNCRILLNLSSGTPQMKTLMQFLAVDSPYHVLGVQVDGPQQNKKISRARTTKHITLTTNWQQTLMMSRIVCRKANGATEPLSRKCLPSSINAIAISC